MRSNFPLSFPPRSFPPSLPPSVRRRNLISSQFHDDRDHGTAVYDDGGSASLAREGGLGWVRRIKESWGNFPQSALSLFAPKAAVGSAQADFKQVGVSRFCLGFCLDLVVLTLDGHGHGMTKVSWHLRPSFLPSFATLGSTFLASDFMDIGLASEALFSKNIPITDALI